MSDFSSNTAEGLSAPTELLDVVNEIYQLSPENLTASDRFVDAGYLSHYQEKLHRLSELAAKLNYVGLHSACLIYEENIQSLRHANKQLDDETHAAIEAWPDLLLNYLVSAKDEATGKTIIEHLQLPVWEQPLSLEDAQMIQMLMEDERQMSINPGEIKPVEIVKATNCCVVNEMVCDAQVSRDKQSDGQSVNDTDNTLPPQILELTAMLIEELPLIEEALIKLLDSEPERDPHAWEMVVEVYNDYLDRFGEATESVGFVALHKIVVLMRENLGLLAAQGRSLTPEEKGLLASWRQHAFDYLNSPYNTSACQELVEWLQDPEWPMPLPTQDGVILLSALQALEFPAIDEEKAEQRPQQATLQDVEVSLPDDVDTTLLNAMLQELPHQTETFSRAIQNLIAGGSMEDVNIAQRIAHTLKGAANTVGVSGIPTLTHHLEDILVALAKQRVLPPPALALTLMNAADCLEAMGEALCGMGGMPDNAQAVLQEVLDWANRIDRDELPPSTLEKESCETQPVEPSVDTPQEPLQQQPAISTNTPVQTGLVDNLLRLGGETIILSGQVKERVRQIEQRILAMQMEFERLHQLGGDLERLIDIRDLSSHLQQQQTSPEFDPLEMDQYSELHTTSRMLVEAANDAHQLGSMITEQLQGLDKMLLTQEHLNREIQETVLNARMVPIKTVVPRLQRNVRQTCRLTGKQVELHVSGAETLMDSLVLNQLVDPLMHVLRNAVDHGIEADTERNAVNKPEIGNIWLDFQRDGNNILVRCRDDGAGIDFTEIRHTAERRGLLEPGQEATHEQLSSMLLLPNFSTRSEVTQTSGRGVGLDVVYSHVNSQGGSLSLKSVVGEGCTTEMRLPLSLISTHALLIRLHDQVVAVADRGIERILHAADGTEHNLGGQNTLWIDEKVYPLKHLEEILQMEPDRRTNERGSRPMLLVNTRTGVTAVPVQEILTGTDLVVKEFGCYVPRMPGILGATILGDGAVTPVLDLPELMSGIHSSAGHMVAESMVDTEQSVNSLPMALVADDSLSARKALVQVMEDAGYEVRTARDGMEAVQIIESRLPDIVLVDMEMPRMNGIELTAHLRTRSETEDLPVIMITSRSTTKHRQQAEAAGIDVYLTKPFLDDELLDHVVRLQGRK